jgi:hypothetical protein
MREGEREYLRERERERERKSLVSVSFSLVVSLSHAHSPFFPVPPSLSSSLHSLTFTCPYTHHSLLVYLMCVCVRAALVPVYLQRHQQPSSHLTDMHSCWLQRRLAFPHVSTYIPAYSLSPVKGHTTKGCMISWSWWTTRPRQSLRSLPLRTHVLVTEIKDAEARCIFRWTLMHCSSSVTLNTPKIRCKYKMCQVSQNKHSAIRSARASRWKCKIKLFVPLGSATLFP